MFKDAELDRLGRHRDDLFLQVKAARDERKRLGQACTRLHDDLDEAFRAQKSAYESNQAAWDQHQSFMRDCSQKIEFNRAESDRCHARMTDAFAESQRAWERGDKAGAKSWSEAGKGHQSQMRAAKEQVAHWITQSKNSQFRFSSSGAASNLESAKSRTRQMKADFEAANARLKAAKAEVERLEVDFEAARSAFDARLDRLKHETPLERTSRVEAEASQEPRRVAKAKELYYAQRGRDYQSGSKGSELFTKVKAGWDRDHDMACTDILIFQRGVQGHHHFVIGENGEVFIDEPRDG